MDTSVITIYVRHAHRCKYTGDEFYKKCNCRKHLRWSKDGKQYRQKAGTRSWAQAEKVKLDLSDQLAGRITEKRAPTESLTLTEASAAFLKGKKVKGIAVGTYAKYELELKRLIEFCGTRNVFTVSGLDLELLNDYKATWPERFPSTNSQHVTQLHIKVFLNYLLHMKGGLAEVPKLDPIKVTSEPTLPLTDAEYEKVLGAAKTKRTRAVIQLMRHSGLAIRDAACLPKSALVMDAKHKTAHVVTKRQKTGTNVRVLVRWAIAEEIKAASLKDGQNLFYNGNAQPISWTRHVGQDVIYTFARAGVNSPSHMVTHRLRDTFACGLLSGGVPMEEVSKLLGHKTIATTEASYSAWVPARQARVDALVAATW